MNHMYPCTMPSPCGGGQNLLLVSNQQDVASIMMAFPRLGYIVYEAILENWSKRFSLAGFEEVGYHALSGSVRGHTAKSHGWP